MLSISHNRTPEHSRWLAGFAFLVFAATLLLMYAGGFTTTIGAGMVFPDWPLSNGSLNPPGWTTDEAMLAEHSHRLLGGTVGTLCIILAFWMWKKEPRKWLRHLAWIALGLVIFQGLLGGLRVLLVNLDLAKVHGVTAQAFLCVLTAIAIGSSRWWKNFDSPEDPEGQARYQQLGMLGLALCCLTVLQLVIGAILRHRGAGMAIPYFPHAAPDGSFLPLAWNWATQIHFLHRVVALVIYLGFGYFLVRALRTDLPNPLRRLILSGFLLLNFQIALGAGIIWSSRAPFETTLHVLNGALFLSCLWGATFTFFRHRMENPAPPPEAKVSKQPYQQSPVSL